MNNLTLQIQQCVQCELSALSYNKSDIDKGYGKLIGFYTGDYKNKIMLVGLNPSYRRFPGIYQAFGGDVLHSGTGWTFISLLKDLKLLDKVYITNLIKCSVSNNNPNVDIYDKCYHNIFVKELFRVNPIKIIALGQKPFNFLKEHLSAEYKKVLSHIYHPVYWIGYNQMTKKEYGIILRKNIC